MNLFELFVKIGVDDQASNNLKSITSKLGNGLKTAAKIGVAAVGAAAAGITALTGAAVKNYAEYEQLVGGAELMFGKAYDTVTKNAKEAYKTVQMSQNEYLKQVNGFATGLKTALGGNEQEAADLAHKIIKAEADIVAATGNTAENVQNAFNGIMKSNFTMLDNLQIGITPTKEGFQEVIDKVNDWNTTNGRATKYQMGNLADMQSALVDYIDMVGMSGYAQAEASKTISGSIASMKSAWSNLVTGIADENAEFGTLVNNFVESASTVLDNILPRIEESLYGVDALIYRMFPIIMERIPRIISDFLPRLAETATMIVQSIMDGISQNKKMLVSSAFEVIMTLANGLLNMLPDIVALGLDLIVSLANGIAESLPELIPTIVDVVLQIVDTLTNPDTLSALIDASIAIIFALADGLIEALPQLLEKAPEIVSNLVTAIIENAPKLLDAAWELIKKLVSGIINSLGEIITAAGQIMSTLKQGIEDYFSEMFEKGKEIVGEIISGIGEWLSKLIEKGKEIIDSVKNGVKQKIQDAKTWGKDLISNFISGLKAKWENLKSTVSGIAQSIKDRLGFSEPKLGPLSNFHTYAPDMIDLFIKGIKDNEKKLTDQIENSFDFGERTIGFGTSFSEGKYTGPYTGNYSGSSSRLDRIEALLTAYLPQLANMSIVAETGQLIGVLSPGINTSLGQMQIYSERGNA